MSFRIKSGPRRSRIVPGRSVLTNPISTLVYLLVSAVWVSPAFAQYDAVLVKDIVPGPGHSRSERLTPVGGMLFFRARQDTTGYELWRSDGTAERTVLVKEIRLGITGADPDLLTAVEGTLFFVANDGIAGLELWKSDGTMEGTVLVKDILPGSPGSNPIGLTAVNGALYFVADDGITGAELWKSDGTREGTVMVSDIRAGFAGASPEGLTSLGGTLFFTADDSTRGLELWKSDGTPEGTVLVRDIVPGAVGSIPLSHELVGLDSTLFFSANDGIEGYELWKSNGTPEGTVLVADIVPGAGSEPHALIPFDGRLFFVARQNPAGYGLWKSDGTMQGTVRVRGLSNDAAQLTALDRLLFFEVHEPSIGTELWRSDGTSNGTVFVKDIRSGGEGSIPLGLTAAGGTLFFAANDGVEGYELWKSDGTSNGTVSVRDIWPGVDGSFPSGLTAVGGTLYFTANDGTAGLELWRTVLAPVMTVETPRLVFLRVTEEDTFLTVTVGDTSWARLPIVNDGLATLTIQSIQVPSSAMRYDGVVPLDIAPGSSDTLAFALEPRVKLDDLEDVMVQTNDPHQPTTRVPVDVDVVELDIETTRLVPTLGKIPLGRNVTVLVFPAPGVRIEEGLLYHRARVTAAFDSIPLVRYPTTDYFQATIPGRFVTELGLDYYVKVKNSGIVVTDPSNAPASVFQQDVESPAAITAVPQPTLGMDYLEERDIRVLVEIPAGSVFLTGSLYYRRGGEGGAERYVSAPIDFSGPLPVGIIPSAFVGSRGVEYWVYVVTETRALTDPPVEPARRPHTLQVRIANIRESGKPRPGETYRLLSIPLSMHGTIAGSITDDLGGPDPTQWRMLVYNPVNGKYVEVPDERAKLTEFEQGRAYWLITREPHRIDTGPDWGETARTDRPFEIELEKGFNLVGCPFNFAVPWHQCLVNSIPVNSPAGRSLVAPPVAWVKDHYQQDAPGLEPFNGHWVHNKSGSRVILKVPAIATSAGADAETAGKATRGALVGDGADPSATWQILLRASSLDLEGQGALLGVDEAASTTSDDHDRMMPPMPPGRFVAVYFPHGDWPDDAGSYAHDIRGDFERVDGTDAWGHAWRFDVAKSFRVEAVGDEVTLEISGIDALPDEVFAYLVDGRLERLIDIRAESRYTFYQGERAFLTDDQDARFVMLVGSEEFVRRQGSGLSRVPAKTVLHQNIPNPFNPSTIIGYELATTGRVSLRIYDVHGALVRFLEDRDRPPGRYEIGWDGNDERGERVATGVYFYRLVAPDFTQTKKLALIK